MKYFIILLFIGLQLSFIYAQEDNLVLTYKVQKNFLESDYNLILGEDVTIWKEISNPSQVDFNPNYMPDDNYTKQILFKDFRAGQVFSDYNILGAHFYVRDSIHNQRWTLVDNEIKNYLGFTCKKAITNYRGRDYVAYYTTEIPINNGPWKFGGLPGMILSIETNTNEEIYKMECVGIEKFSSDTKTELKEYLKKIRKKNLLSWTEFRSDFNSFLERYIKSMRSEIEADGDSGFTIQFSVDNQPEVFSEEIQLNGVLLEF
jgi:GLPGLI family protein